MGIYHVIDLGDAPVDLDLGAACPIRVGSCLCTYIVHTLDIGL
jgi:hypothetical protein